MTVRYILQLLCLMMASYLCATEITVVPKNTAVKRGDSATLECRANMESSDKLEWKVHYHDAHSGTRVYLTGEGVKLPGYSIRTESQGQHDLVITSATEDFAYLYGCGLHIDGLVKSAYLVVIDPMDCRSDETMEIGEELTFWCSVNYYGPREPHLHITLDGNSIVGGTKSSNTLRLDLNVTGAMELDGKEFVCEVLFDGNDPVYKDECKTHIYIKYPPKDLAIYPDPDEYVERIIPRKLGDNITCTADGRPEPEIWFSKANSTEHETNGDTMRIVEDHLGRHTYACNAQNNAGNRMNIVRKEFTFDASAGPGGSTGGQSGLANYEVSRVIAHVIVVVFSFLLHNYS